MEIHRTGIVALAFGAPHILPSNILIGNTARYLADRFQAPILTQKDIQVPMNSRQTKITYFKGEVSGNPPSTFKILENAMQWARDNTISELIIVAALPHQKRIKRDLKLMDKRFKKVTYRFGAFENNPSSAVWYSGDSFQWWTKSSSLWKLREYILMKMPISWYKKLSQ